jgi:hypothetical protein
MSIPDFVLKQQHSSREVRNPGRNPEERRP